ncbi:chorismate synthase [Breznakia sp. PF5-3]|uniref:chorismate synthase n=1 Tax=unclassified Breznakia TaxID=2623764 RepID=UPI0024063705|nr:MULTISPECIES: chorismate synthase [unclassified Breznakia]MDL2276788.1 chorismate synthase [Breznakia sp. OttesenSCG-928-G09]MDF9825272.1 chorismate synthase [Breznakia sp. PM6-1]MDF9836138.1 chorismate synthase [Breznakia sp. PF5-3]MDF9838175.1 chorismate synthase [Breznakia sp. PFB2-8]MDF9860161.1 chorismate synthase [Breznakia sp. PH5-24]
MKSTIGEAISITIFGESHGKAIGAMIDGLCPGITLDFDYINHQLDLRKPKGRISTQRKESDEINIVSGYFDNHTTGTPLCILMENNNTQSKDYRKSKDLMRPSHADYTANLKYLGYQDYRGGGHFSGRLSAPLVAVGSICNQILQSKGIFIGSHLASVLDIEDDAFASEELDLIKQIQNLNKKHFPTINQDIEHKMKEKIEAYAIEGDSVGGVIESAIVNLPAGIGEPFFHSIESVLSSLIFSVPAVKGVEFGLGFAFANHVGSEVNDAFIMKDNNIKTKTNNNGGINGGISNGMPIIIKTVIKPTPSIYKKQETVNYKTKENTVLQIEGRHDPAIVHRARVVIDSVIAIGLLDLLTQRFGYLWMGE